MDNDIKVCSICGVVFKGFGNNPWPITDGEDDRCCDRCNADVVVPERIRRMIQNDGTE